MKVSAPILKKKIIDIFKKYKLPSKHQYPPLLYLSPHGLEIGVLDTLYMPRL